MKDPCGLLISKCKWNISEPPCLKIQSREPWRKIPTLPSCLYMHMCAHTWIHPHIKQKWRRMSLWLSPPTARSREEWGNNQRKQARKRQSGAEGSHWGSICLFRRGKPSHSGFRTSPLVQKSNGKVPVPMAIVSTNAHRQRTIFSPRIWNEPR